MVIAVIVLTLIVAAIVGTYILVTRNPQKVAAVQATVDAARKL